MINIYTIAMVAYPLVAILLSFFNKDLIVFAKAFSILLLFIIIVKNKNFNKYKIILLFIFLMFFKNILYDGFDGLILFLIGIYSYVTFAVILEDKVFKNTNINYDVANLVFIITIAIYTLFWFFKEDNFRFTQIINPNNMGLYALGMLMLCENSNKYKNITKILAVAVVAATMSRGINLACLGLAIMFYIDNKSKKNLLFLFLVIIISINTFINRGNLLAQNLEDSGRIGQMYKAVNGMSTETKIVYDEKFSQITVSTTANQGLKSNKYLKYIWGDSFGSGTNAIVNIGYLFGKYDIDILKYNRGTGDSGFTSLFINGGIIFYLVIIYLYIYTDKLRKNKYNILMPATLLVLMMAQAYNETFPGVFLLLMGIKNYRSD